MGAIQREQHKDPECRSWLEYLREKKVPQDSLLAAWLRRDEEVMGVSNEGVLLRLVRDPTTKEVSTRIVVPWSMRAAACRSVHDDDQMEGGRRGRDGTLDKLRK